MKMDTKLKKTGKNMGFDGTHIAYKKGHAVLGGAPSSPAMQENFKVEYHPKVKKYGATTSGGF